MEILILVLVAVLLYLIAYYQGRDVGKLESRETREMEIGPITLPTTLEPKENLRWKIFQKKKQGLERVHRVLFRVSVICMVVASIGIAGDIKERSWGVPVGLLFGSMAFVLALITRRTKFEIYQMEEEFAGVRDADED